MAGKLTLRGVHICEGSADRPLGDIVERLLVERGMDARIEQPDLTRLVRGASRRVADKMQAALNIADGDIDFFVIHRDADNAGRDSRLAEISAARRQLNNPKPVLPVIPTRMTEAWLLVDEESIRRVAGNPRGRNPLELPALHEIEHVADAKTELRRVLLSASGLTGRRRERIKREFSRQRGQLLQQLDPHGPITRLHSWSALLTDIGALVSDCG